MSVAAGLRPSASAWKSWLGDSCPLDDVWSVAENLSSAKRGFQSSLINSQSSATLDLPSLTTPAFGHPSCSRRGVRAGPSPNQDLLTAAEGAARSSGAGFLVTGVMCERKNSPPGTGGVDARTLVRADGVVGRGESFICSLPIGRSAKRNSLFSIFLSQFSTTWKGRHLTKIYQQTRRAEPAASFVCSRGARSLL